MKKKVLNILYSAGAAVVILGAWAKITHQIFADTMLTIGLFTEAFIFIMYALNPDKEVATEIPKLATPLQPMEVAIAQLGTIEELNKLKKNTTDLNKCFEGMIAGMKAEAGKL